MKKYRLFILLTVALLVTVFTVNAASDTASHDVTMNVTEIVLLDLNDTAAVVLNTTTPTNGGEDPIGSTDSSKLLQYTSLVPTGQTRSLTVQWGGTDAAPAGTSLSLEATSVPAGCGTAAPSVTLSSVAQPLITAIGSCATGTGANGAQLTFTFSVDTVTSLVVGDNKTVTLTYTLTDAS